MKKILAMMVLLLGLFVYTNVIHASSTVNVPGNLSYDQEIALDEVLGTRVCLTDNFGILYYLEISNGKITGIADHPLCDTPFKVTGGYEGVGFRIHLRGTSHGDCVNYLYEGAVSSFDKKTAIGKWKNSRKGGKGWFTLAPYTGDNLAVIDKSEAGSGMPGIFSDKETSVSRTGDSDQISSQAISGSILDVFGPTILLKDNFDILYDLTLNDNGMNTGTITGVITHVCCGTYTTKDGILYSYHNDKNLAIYLNKDINKEFCYDLPNQLCVDFKCYANLVGTSTLSGTWQNVRMSQASRSSRIYSTGSFTLTAFESPGGIYGRVTDSATGVGILNSSIKLIAKVNELLVDEATSDSNGDYKLQHVWVGKEYTLVAFMDGYGEQSRSCKLEKAEKDSGKEYSFSLKESIRPYVKSTIPSDGKKEIALATDITATFSEPMDASTINDQTFLLNSKESLRRILKGSRGIRRKSVTGVVTYNAAKQMATFTPASKLSYNSTYEAVITTGVKDTTGNNMQSSYKWSFSTEHNEPPQVDARVDLNINVGALASLDATVTDDGLPKDGTLTTLWTKLSGTGTVAFGNASAVDTTASFSTSGVYVLELKADDGGLSATDTVTINVNSAPLVDAGSDRIIDFGKTVSLDGTITDDGLPIPPGALTITWTQLSGTGTVSFGNANAVDTTATFSSSGDYVLELRADDGGMAAADTVTVTVNAVTYTLTLDAAGVQGDAAVMINDTSIGTLLLNDGAGYSANSIRFDLSLLRNGENTLSISSPLSSGSDKYDDIQIAKIKLVKTNEDKVVLADEVTYHIGDQTIAEITDSYNKGTWTDPNLPAFWTELVGTDLVVTFTLTLD